MANAIYDKYKEALLGSANNASLLDGNVKVSLVDTADVTFSAIDEFYSDVLNANTGVVATASVANVTVTDGVFNADDVLFETVTGDQAEALMLWIDTGDANTSRLVAWMDTNIDGLPITPDSSNVVITWSTSGIFKL